MAFQWPRSAALLYNPTIRGHGRKVSGLARVAASRYQASACGSSGGRWSFSLTQTKGLLSAIAGTAARQSTAHIPIAISRITDPASSRVELRRSPGRGGVARGYLLPNWENEDRGRHQFADRGSSRISQAFHPAYTTLHLKEASSFRRRAREKGCTPAALRDGDLIVAKCLWIIMLNQLIVASKLIARRSITLTGSTTGIHHPQFLFLGHINIEFTQLGQCWRVPQTSGFIQEGQTIGSRVLTTGTITNHCPHIIEPLRHIQIYHLLIEIQCLLRIFSTPPGHPVR